MFLTSSARAARARTDALRGDRDPNDNRPDHETVVPSAQSVHMRRLLLRSGALIVVLAGLATFAGSIPFIGRLLLWLAPDALLVGTWLVLTALLLTINRRALAAVLLATLLGGLIGLNTRLPSFAADLARTWHEARITQPMQLAPGQPVHLAANTKVLAARIKPYASAFPSCLDALCFVTSGFRALSPGLGTDYWTEDVEAVVGGLGLTTARAGAKAPTIEVQWDAQGDISELSVRVVSAGGSETATLRRAYRNGFPLESKDSAMLSAGSNVWLGLQYLLHGNSVNRLAQKSAPAAREPLRPFLAEAIAIKVPTRQAQEVVILEDRRFGPDREISPADRERLGGIARRQRCDEFLRTSEKESGWLVFRSDPDGQRRVRNEMHVFCDADAVWLVSQVPGRNEVFIYGYSPTGEKRVELAFEPPPAPTYYRGALVVDSFKAEEGRVSFEWWVAVARGPTGLFVQRALKLAVPTN